MQNEYRGKVLVALELPVHYVVRLGLNPLVMEAHLSGTYYPLTVLPPDAQARVMDAVIEAAKEQAAEPDAMGADDA
jgi:hypothetical protein